MQGELVRGVLALGCALFALAIAPAVFAEGAPCFNDTDCPNAACGGEVCNWNKLAANPVGDKAYVCQPAGIGPKGADGWCTTDVNCKCRPQGAKCVTVYCSFTQSADAPSSGGSSSVAGTGSSSLAGTGSTTSTAGTPASSGTRSTVDAPTDESDTNSSSSRLSRSCSVGAPTTSSGSFLLLPAVGIALAAARRRAKHRAP